MPGTAGPDLEVGIVHRQDVIDYRWYRTASKLAGKDHALQDTSQITVCGRSISTGLGWYVAAEQRAEDLIGQSNVCARCQSRMAIRLELALYQVNSDHGDAMAAMEVSTMKNETYVLIKIAGQAVPDLGRVLNGVPDERGNILVRNLTTITYPVRIHASQCIDVNDHCARVKASAHTTATVTGSVGSTASQGPIHGVEISCYWTRSTDHYTWMVAPARPTLAPMPALPALPGRVVATAVDTRAGLYTRYHLMCRSTAGGRLPYVLWASVGSSEWHEIAQAMSAPFIYDGCGPEVDWKVL